MIKKCLFPVAGYGTRFLPATKSMPKEMMPIVNKPLVQYGVEEAFNAGMTDMAFVTGRGKRAIPDHFDVSYELEAEIKGTGKEKQLEEIRNLILGVDERMEEDIKWGAPTFIYKGNLATFNPRAKKFVNLTFHTGAMIEDPNGVLEGEAKEARVVRVASQEDLDSKRTGIEAVVRNWLTLKDPQ